MRAQSEPRSRGACPEEQMAGEGARPREQAHLRGGCREQAHDGGLGGPAQGAETVTEGATDHSSMDIRQTQRPRRGLRGSVFALGSGIWVGFGWDLVTP